MHKRTTTIDFCGYCSGSHKRSYGSNILLFKSIVSGLKCLCYLILVSLVPQEDEDLIAKILSSKSSFCLILCSCQLYSDDLNLSIIPFSRIFVSIYRQNRWMTILQVINSLYESDDTSLIGNNLPS
jgi:hypothetical protein